MVKTILIISSDEEYNISIEHKLSFALKEDVRFDLISSSDYLHEYLKSPHNLSILIVDPTFISHINGIIRSEKAYILTESATTKDGEISKYGGADSIIRELDDSFLRRSFDDKSRDTKIIGVCSPSGGSGKTVSAVGLCLRLSEMGKKVLYLNTQSFQTFESVIDKSGAFSDSGSSYSKGHAVPNDRYTISDGERMVQSGGRVVMTDEVKRAIAAGSPNAGNVVLANVRKGKFDHIPQSMDLLTSYQVTEDKLFRVAGSIATKKLYDYIVIEFESGLSASRITLISECDRLVIVVCQDEESAKRLERFVHMIPEGHKEIAIVCARCRQNKPNEIYSLSILKDNPICEYIPERDDIADIFESREGMNYYRKTAEAVM